MVNETVGCKSLTMIFFSFFQKRQKFPHNTYSPLTMKDSVIAICSSPYGVEIRERHNEKLRTLKAGACNLQQKKKQKHLKKPLKVRRNEVVGHTELASFPVSYSLHILSHRQFPPLTRLSDFFF